MTSLSNSPKPSSKMVMLGLISISVAKIEKKFLNGEII